MHHIIITLYFKNEHTVAIETIQEENHYITSNLEIKLVHKYPKS